MSDAFEKGTQKWLNSGQKMALRAVYVLKRYQRHLLATIEHNRLKGPIFVTASSSQFYFYFFLKKYHCEVAFKGGPQITTLYNHDDPASSHILVLPGCTSKNYRTILIESTWHFV